MKQLKTRIANSVAIMITIMNNLGCIVKVNFMIQIYLNIEGTCSYYETYSEVLATKVTIAKTKFLKKTSSITTNIHCSTKIRVTFSTYAEVRISSDSPS